MKKKLLFALLIIGTTNSYCQQWWQQNSESNNDFNVIFALNNSTVWTFGDSSDTFGGYAYGSQYKTTNQGFNWGFIDMGSPVYSARDCEFINPGTGLLVGRNELSGNGFVRSTTDGGYTWIDQNPHPEKLEGVEYVSQLKVFACGRNDYAVLSMDGGMTWTNIDANTGDHLIDLDFPNDSLGYVVGRGGVIAHTINSGASWTNQTSNTGEDLEGVWFINDSTGWAVGTAGEIIFTEDYGTTWTAQTSGTTEDMMDVEFVNDTTGWAVGTAGTVLKTIDAGQNWVAETSGTTEDIISITMISETLGWYAGTNGVVYIYSFSPPNSIAENEFNMNVSVYPIPTSDYLTIELDEIVSNLKVELFDISGRLIYQNSFNGELSHTIANNRFEKGVYLLQLTNVSGARYAKKVYFE